MKKSTTKMLRKKSSSLKDKKIKEGEEFEQRLLTIVIGIIVTVSLLNLPLAFSIVKL